MPSDGSDSKITIGNDSYVINEVVEDGPLGNRIKSLPVLSKHPSGSLPNTARDQQQMQRA